MTRLDKLNGATVRYAIQGNDKMASKAEKLAKAECKRISAKVRASM